MLTAKVTEAVAAVCPVIGVSIGRKDDKATWRIDFKPEATAPQRSAAQGVVDAFDTAAAEAPPSATQLEADCIAGAGAPPAPRDGFDLHRAFIAHVISTEAYRIGVAPGALTPAQLAAIRQRVANIYKAL